MSTRRHANMSDFDWDVPSMPPYDEWASENFERWDSAASFAFAEHNGFDIGSATSLQCKVLNEFDKVATFYYNPRVVGGIKEAMNKRDFLMKAFGPFMPRFWTNKGEARVYLKTELMLEAAGHPSPKEHRKKSFSYDLVLGEWKWTDDEEVDAMLSNVIDRIMAGEKTEHVVDQLARMDFTKATDNQLYRLSEEDKVRAIKTHTETMVVPYSDNVVVPAAAYRLGSRPDATKNVLRAAVRALPDWTVLKGLHDAWEEGRFPVALVMPRASRSRDELLKFTTYCKDPKQAEQMYFMVCEDEEMAAIVMRLKRTTLAMARDWAERYGRIHPKVRQRPFDAEFLAKVCRKHPQAYEELSGKVPKYVLNAIGPYGGW